MAAVCILATSGELNVSTSIVDDEGVDLVFHRRGGSATLAVQVKARMSTGVLVGQERFMAFVRAQTFRPRSDLYMLFVGIDVANGSIMMAWLVPSSEFSAMAGEPNAQGRLRFSASMKPNAADRWASYRLTVGQLPQHVLTRLAELEGTGAAV